MEPKIAAAVPVDEIHRVTSAPRLRVRLEPFFDARGVDVEDRPGDRDQILCLIVVKVLERRRRSFHADARDVLEELVGELGLRLSDRVMEPIFQTHLTSVQSIESRISDHGGVGFRKPAEQIILVHLVFTKSNENNFNWNPLARTRRTRLVRVRGSRICLSADARAAVACRSAVSGAAGDTRMSASARGAAARKVMGASNSPRRYREGMDVSTRTEEFCAEDVQSTKRLQGLVVLVRQSQ